MKILVLAYSVSPTIGSEYSVGWNHIQTISKQHEVTVIFGESSGDFSNFDPKPLQEYLYRNPVPSVEWLPCIVEMGLFERFANSMFSWIPHNGYKYRLWHRRALAMAKSLINEQGIDVIHYLNPIGFKEPGYLWQLEAAYVWGPVQGVNLRPFALLSPLPIREKLSIFARNFLHLFALRYSPRVRAAFNSADVVVAATSASRDQFKRFHNIEAYYLPENGIQRVHPINMAKFENPRLEIAWIGSVDWRKSLATLLDSLQKLQCLDQVTLHVIGTGPALNEMKDLAKRLHVDGCIRWHGKVSREEVIDLLGKIHLHIITSNGEGNPTVIWEAMANGIPTISLDHCGMHDTVNDKCGKLIAISSYEQIISDIAKEVEGFLNDRPRLRALSESTLAQANHHKVDGRLSFFNTIYNQAIRQRRSKFVK